MTDLGDELTRYREAKQSAAGSLHTMSGLLCEGSPMEVVLGNLAGSVADHLDRPAPFNSVLPPWVPLQKPIPTVWDGPHWVVRMPEGCYEASWGWVHVRPSCRCPR